MMRRWKHHYNQRHTGRQEIKTESTGDADERDTDAGEVQRTEDRHKKSDQQNKRNNETVQDGRYTQKR